MVCENTIALYQSSGYSHACGLSSAGDLCVLSTDLACMYKLLCRVPNGRTTLMAAVSGHLRDEGRSLVAEDPCAEGGRNPVVYIQSLLDLKDKYDNFLHKSFGSDAKFKSAIQTVSEPDIKGSQFFQCKFSAGLFLDHVCLQMISMCLVDMSMT